MLQQTRQTCGLRLIEDFLVSVVAAAVAAAADVVVAAVAFVAFLLDDIWRSVAFRHVRAIATPSRRAPS